MNLDKLKHLRKLWKSFDYKNFCSWLAGDNEIDEIHKIATQLEVTISQAEMLYARQ